MKEKELYWIDDFINQVREYIFVREKDGVLILPPNRVYKLNKTGIKILTFLLQGGNIRGLLKSLPKEDKIRKDILYFFQDLVTLIKTGKVENMELNAVEFREFSNDFYVYPILSEFAVTYRCNLRCKFCYVSASVKKNGELDTRDAKKIINIIKTDAMVPFLSFTGGEPTLRKDLPELIAYARKIGLRVNLITNGTLITREYAERLREAGLQSAQVSIEGPIPEVHDELTGVPGSFQKTIEGVKNLIRARIYVHTNTTLNRKNVNYLNEFIELFRSLGLKRFSMNLIIPEGNALSHQELYLKYSEVGENINFLKEKAREHGIEFMWYSPLPMCIYNTVMYGLGSKKCAACHGLLSVDPYGNILPCSSYPGAVGNLLEENFEEIWFSEKCKFFREMHYVPEECKECDLKEKCGAACPLYWRAVGSSELREIRADAKG